MLESDLTPPQQMVRLLMGFISARAIYTGAKLDLADQIDDAGSTVEQLSARLGVDRSALERLLRSLTGLGVLHGNDSGQFFLTPVGETLRRSSPGSIRDYAIYVHEFLYDLVGGLPSSVRTGKPIVEEVFGAPLFTHLQQHPDKAALFHAGLANRSRIETPAILDAYSFGDCRRVADLGGGNGDFSLRHCHCTSFCLRYLVGTYSGDRGGAQRPGRPFARLRVDRRRLFRRRAFRCRYLRPQACSLRSQRRRRRANFAQLSSGNEFERPACHHRRACRIHKRTEHCPLHGPDIPSPHDGPYAYTGTIF